MPAVRHDRRSFIRLAAAAPLLASLGTRSLAQSVARAAVSATGTRSFSDNIFTKLGIRPFINARGTWTYLSGSLELPEVRTAVEQASHFFVDIFELQQAAGRHLAKLSGAEFGMVTGGSSAAIAAATAGCMAGTDKRKVYQLPDTTGMKNEVVMLGGRTAFDSAIRLAGAKLAVARTVNDLAAAITPHTAMVYTTWRDDRLAAALKITKSKNVPLMLDDAAGIPPFEYFSRPAKLGVDLYCFSGGKGLRGPQSSGVLLGRKDLIDAAMANTSPWEGAICRSMKVGKEEVMGVLAAIDYWSHTDIAPQMKTWQTYVERIKKLIETVPGVTGTITVPTAGNSYPTLTVDWDEAKFGLTVAQCDAALRSGTPRIEALTDSNPSGVLPEISNTNPNRQGAHKNQLQIVSMNLQPGEDLILGNRLRTILNDARKKSSA